MPSCQRKLRPGVEYRSRIQWAMQMNTMSETTGHLDGHLPAGAARLSYVFARPRVVATACVIILASLGWLFLALMAARSAGSPGDTWLGTALMLCRPLRELPSLPAAAAIILSMWCAMTLATMLPSAAPMILTYSDIAETAAHKGQKIISPIVLAGGYASVWFGFSAIAAALQISFPILATTESSASTVGGLLSGAIFVGAGVYQFSALKRACLTHCRQPFQFFFTNWSTTVRGVFRLGLKQGLYCLGCCWAMMLVMFAVGTMNIVWMAALGALMTAEKMVTGQRFSQVIGAALIVGGAAILVAAFFAHWPVSSG